MKVLIIFGGSSTEHEVSCVSAASVLNNIKGHDVTKFGITKDVSGITPRLTMRLSRTAVGKTTNPTGKCSRISIPALLYGTTAV